MIRDHFLGWPAALLALEPEPKKQRPTVQCVKRTEKEDEDKTIEVRLTPEQLEKLIDVLWDAQDEGPTGYGWASPELEKLRALFGAAREGQQKT